MLRYINRSLSGRGNMGVLLCFPGLLAFTLAALAIERLALALARRDEQVGGGCLFGCWGM